ncbi:MAG: radical SAM protein [Candidatus Daviesbacteria bacterium]|nr:radical SAM protein [Candidatus Daviesbacteria bacterium]
MVQKTTTPEILLVAPNSFAERDIPELKSRGGAFSIPSVGILCVATYLKKEGYDVAVLDADKELLTEEETVAKIQELMPNGGFVGWAGWITTIDKTARIAAKLKSKSSKYRQFLGGPHPSAVPIRTMEKYGDIFSYEVVGEGELVTPILIKNWDNQEFLKKVPGIVFKDNKGKLHYLKDTVRGYTRLLLGNKPSSKVDWPTHADRIEDINKLPIPEYELLGDLTRYHLSEFTPQKGEFQLAMLTSRGCPNACFFCDQEVSGHMWRGLTPKRIIEHMEYLRRLGVVDFYLTDDLYLVSLDVVEETARRILKNKNLKGCIWTAITRANLVVRAAKHTVTYQGSKMNLLELIYKAGCRQLHIAPETGNEELRYQAIGKRISNQTIEDATEAMAKAGIEVKLLNMVGLPGETPKQTLETLKYIQKLEKKGAVYAMISICTPLPNTQLAILIEQGILKWTGNLDDWSSMTLWNAAGVFTTDINGKKADNTPLDILYACRGKHRLGKLVTKKDYERGETLEQKIKIVEKMVDDYYSKKQKKSAI